MMDMAQEEVVLVLPVVVVVPVAVVIVVQAPLLVHVPTHRALVLAQMLATAKIRKKTKMRGKKRALDPAADEGEVVDHVPSETLVVVAQTLVLLDLRLSLHRDPPTHRDHKEVITIATAKEVEPMQVLHLRHLLPHHPVLDHTVKVQMTKLIYLRIVG